MTLTVGQSAQQSVLAESTALASALAWPIAAIVIALLFKRELVELARKASVASVEAFGIKVDFDKAAENLAEATREAAQDDPVVDVETMEPTGAAQPAQENEPVPPPPMLERSKPTFSSVGFGTAEGKVVKGWLAIEEALRFAAEENDLWPSSKPLEILHDLATAGAIGSETVALVEEARRLRNAVVHGQASDLTFLSAQRYAHSANGIAERIRAESKR